VTGDAGAVEAALEELKSYRAKGAGVEELLGAQFDLGLAWPHFRIGHGGLGASLPQSQEIARHLYAERFPQSPASFVGLNQAARVLHDYAPPALQRRFLRRIYTGADQWCQLFSEPGAGSDLANVATRATFDGNRWQMDGQKLWTSNARHSQYALLLTRTDPAATKHAGLSMFVLDMRQDGVEVRPLRQMDGGERFSEVYLNAATAPSEFLLGEVGQGWALSMHVLGTERESASELFGRPISEVVDLWQQRRDVLAPALRDHVVRLWIRSRVGEVSGQRLRTTQRPDEAARLRGIAKITASERAQAHAEVIALLLGPELVTGADYAGAASEDGDAASAQSTDFTRLPPARFVLRSRAMSIEGGTNQIARNIVGERVLGLPSEPRVDKNRPWNEKTRA
jgi:alkylation response protein AidB-like acyl-CoA dehydrogenase